MGDRAEMHEGLLRVLTVGMLHHCGVATVSVSDVWRLNS